MSSRSSEYNIASNYKIYGAMILGLVTAICFRLIVIVNYLEPNWVRPIWYFAVFGNLIFFYYRFKVSQKRKGVIIKNRLIDKIGSGVKLTDKERKALVYLLQSIERSPESINYLIISIFSIIAIMTDVIMAYIF